MGKDISTLLAVLKRRSLPAIVTFAAVMAGAVAYLKTTPQMYETSARLMLDDKRVSVSELGQNLSQQGQGTPGGANPLATQAELIKSQKVLERAQKKLVSSDTHNLKIADISKGLKVKIVPATNILELSYQGQNPDLAARILNVVSTAMVEESADAIRREAASVRKFLEKEVPQRRQRLKLAEAAENTYRQQSGVISFADQSKSLIDGLAKLEDQERDLLTQLQEVRSRQASLQQITAANPKTAYAAVRGGQDEQLKSLRAKLAELEAQVVETRLRFTDNHPSLVSLIERRDALRALYNQELARVGNNQALPPKDVASDQLSQELTSKLVANQVDSQALEKKLQAVQVERGNLQTRLTQLPMKQQPLTALTRQREEAGESLKLLQSKLEEARIAEAQLVSNVRIIERAAVSTSPTSPKLAATLAIAGVFGLILATGMVLLLEVMDNTLRDTSEVAELLEIPVLGVLPKLPAKTISLHLPERFLDDTSLVEPYRMLLKTLELGHSGLRVIAVSSTLSGEGKSVVVAHLAAVSAMLSRRTLVIDADLHRPVQHKLFNLPAFPGITHVIEGETSLLQAVQTTHIDNLSVLTCGEMLQRPAAVLESAAMQNLLAEAASQYDVVIIDTPPLSNSVDAVTLGRSSDGLMLIARPDFTPKELLLQTVSETSRTRTPILGIIANGMTGGRHKYYRYSVAGNLPLFGKSVRRLREVK
jgi:capsular exopolysaccharide synthesis family protein